jgi:hypothetical protein
MMHANTDWPALSAATPADHEIRHLTKTPSQARGEPVAKGAVIHAETSLSLFIPSQICIDKCRRGFRHYSHPQIQVFWPPKLLIKPTTGPN